MTQDPSDKKPRNDSLEAPHSEEAEMGVLGCILQEALLGGEQTAIVEARARIKDAEAFYILKNRYIWQAMCELQDENVKLDTITLLEKLKKMGRAEDSGGVAYWSSLPDSIPSTTNLPHYLNIVEERYVLRRMIQAGQSIVDQAMNYKGKNVAEFVGAAEQQFFEATKAKSSDEKPIRALVHEVIADLEQNFNYAQQGTRPPGIEIGFRDLDALLLGLHFGEVTYLAARPSMGKSTLAQNVAEHNVLKANPVPTAVFSLEMKDKSWVLRMMAAQTGVSMKTLRNGQFTEADFAKFTTTAGKLSKAPLHIYAEPGLTIESLQSKIRYAVARHGVKLVIIDYMQLISASNHRASREQQIAHISRGIHNITGELDIATLALCQLNRDLEKDKNRKPRMSDLRESGSLEQDADNLWMLWSPPGEDGEPQPNTDTCAPKQVGVVIPKQRNGPQGEVMLQFVPQCTRFQDIPIGSKLDETDFTWAKDQE